MYALTFVVDTVSFISFPAFSALSTKNQYGLEGAGAVLGLPEKKPPGSVALLGVAAASLYAQ